MKPLIPRPDVHRGFTLLEALVAIAIGTAVSAMGWPVLKATVRDVRTYMAVNQAAVALQANAFYAHEYAQANADAAEPRVTGSTYAGGAVVFDQVNHKAWFCINNQRAIPNAPDITPYLETEDDYADPATGAMLKKKAYDRIRGNTIEHLDLPAHQVYYGVSVDRNADGSIKEYSLVGPRTAAEAAAPPSFAVCAFATGEGMPQRTHVFVDLLDGYGYQPVATAMPMVLVVPLDGGAEFDVTHLDVVPGATDTEKVNALLKQGHAQLLSLALGGLSKT